ncbi:Hypothetical_protein [Hexamita inflata]|uniref:Hypothetical_protein n=1 Tax=Hexamita inflata TaxID=28002 RepID=A0AA86VAA1_9EUKA|nr:Hypothetical protein HINF_LOCUS48573 [Hexamita inflata]
MIEKTINRFQIQTVQLNKQISGQNSTHSAKATEFIPLADNSMQRQLNRKINVLSSDPSQLDKKQNSQCSKCVLYDACQVNDSLFDISENSFSEPRPIVLKSAVINQSSTSCSASASQYVCWDQFSKVDVVLYTQSNATMKRSLITIETRCTENGTNVENYVEDDLFAYVFAGK